MNMCSWNCGVPRIQSWLPWWFIAVVFVRSVAIRVTSSEDLQLTSVRRALHLC